MTLRVINQGFTAIHSSEIPNEIVSKFWIRAYTAESFYKKMNECLRLDKINDYLLYIQMMYEGVRIKSLTFEPKKKLYRGAYFDPQEIKDLQEFLEEKTDGLPAAIVYSKSFLSFSLDKKVALGFMENVLLIIEEFLEGNNYCSGCASAKKFSFYKDEEEILVFPFSSFEITNIEKVEKESYFKIP